MFHSVWQNPHYVYFLHFLDKSVTCFHILTNLVSNKIPNFPLQVAKKRIILVFLVFVLLTLLMCGYYKYTLYNSTN